MLPLPPMSDQDSVNKFNFYFSEGGMWDEKLNKHRSFLIISFWKVKIKKWNNTGISDPLSSKEEKKFKNIMGKRNVYDFILNNVKGYKEGTS